MRVPITVSRDLSLRSDDHLQWIHRRYFGLQHPGFGHRKFGVVLREARMRAGLSQEELADRSSLDVTYISLLERGLRSPSLDALFAIAGGLRTPASFLVKDTE
jgi:DNA-binding XRE family transcriptional regulator